MSKLDKILGINQHGLKGKVRFTTDQKEQIKSLFLEIVGEDEKLASPDALENIFYRTRNGVRVDLRKKIKEL